MITPVGVTKPKGMKKGKVFVDDQVCFSFLDRWIEKDVCEMGSFFFAKTKN